MLRLIIPGKGRRRPTVLDSVSPDILSSDASSCLIQIERGSLHVFSQQIFPYIHKFHIGAVQSLLGAVAYGNHRHAIGIIIGSRTSLTYIRILNPAASRPGDRRINGDRIYSVHTVQIFLLWNHGQKIRIFLPFFLLQLTGSLFRIRSFCSIIHKRGVNSADNIPRYFIIKRKSLICRILPNIQAVQPEFKGKAIVFGTFF